MRHNSPNQPLQPSTRHPAPPGSGAQSAGTQHLIENTLQACENRGGRIHSTEAGVLSSLSPSRASSGLETTAKLHSPVSRALTVLPSVHRLCLCLGSLPFVVTKVPVPGGFSDAHHFPSLQCSLVKTLHLPLEAQNVTFDLVDPPPLAQCPSCGGHANE